jgi:hypothetical protein
VSFDDYVENNVIYMVAKHHTFYIFKYRSFQLSIFKGLPFLTWQIL